MAQGERHAEHGRLGEVVEEGVAVVVAVVLGGAVGHLHDQATGVAQQQRQCVVAGDRVRLDGEPQQPQALAEVVLPDRAVPLEEQLTAPDVVHEDVQASLLVRDALHERTDAIRIEMVGGYGDPVPTGSGDEVGGVLDGLRPVVLRTPLPRAAAGDVHRGPSRPQLHGHPAPRPPRRPRDQRDPAHQRPCHVRPPIPVHTSLTDTGRWAGISSRVP
jgi:hypothetical protein